VGLRLPLYRQSQMLARQGITLDRSTLGNWVGRACWWLPPLYDLVVGSVLSATKIFADDTKLPVLDPGRGRTKSGSLWCYAVDDRTWRGPGHPAAAYIYSADRKNERPAGHLSGFRGVLQVDGYDGFKRLAENRDDGAVRLAFCWVHMRRSFYEVYTSTKSPLAAEVLTRIRSLYAIEAEIRLAAALMGECEEIDHQPARRFLRQPFEHPVKAHAIGVAGEQLVAVDDDGSNHCYKQFDRALLVVGTSNGDETPWQGADID
jgi:hypothetical protein